MKGYVNPGLAAARVRTQFKPGNTGRPPGTRTKLGLLFVNALCEDFERHGAEALRRVREEDPATYMRVVASILPRELEIKRPLAELSDDELTRAIDVIRLALASPLMIEAPALPQH
jgi:hypothetical protein